MRMNQEGDAAITSFVQIIVRQFAGIAAFVERAFASDFTARCAVEGDEDVIGGALMSGETRAEIEIADFDRLFAKLDKVEMRSAEMKALLALLKEAGEKAEAMAATTGDAGRGG